MPLINTPLAQKGLAGQTSVRLTTWSIHIHGVNTLNKVTGYTMCTQHSHCIVPLSVARSVLALQVTNTVTVPVHEQKAAYDSWHS